MRRVKEFNAYVGKSIIMCLIAILFLNIGCKGKDVLYRSKKEVVIIGEYMAWACGEYTPRIIPKGSFDSVDIKNIKYGLVFWIIPEKTSPDQIEELGVQGNKFELHGYYYYSILNGTKYLSPRFDLVSWKPIVPFKRWKENGEIEVVKKEIADYQKYFERTSGSSNEFKQAGKYVSDCP